MSEFINIKNQDYSFLGQGSTISGKFKLKGTTHLASRLDGELSMEDSSDLIIETAGKFEGNINCHNLEIYGTFKGNLNSTGKLTVYPPAFVEGEIQAANIVIHPGATINMNGHTVDS